MRSNRNQNRTWVRQRNSRVEWILMSNSNKPKNKKTLVDKEEKEKVVVQSLFNLSNHKFLYKGAYAYTDQGYGLIKNIDKKTKQFDISFKKGELTTLDFMKVKSHIPINYILIQGKITQRILSQTPVNFKIENQDELIEFIQKTIGQINAQLQVFYAGKFLKGSLKDNDVMPNAKLLVMTSASISWVNFINASVNKKLCVTSQGEGQSLKVKKFQPDSTDQRWILVKEGHLFQIQLQATNLVWELTAKDTDSPIKLTQNTKNDMQYFEFRKPDNRLNSKYYAVVPKTADDKRVETYSGSATDDSIVSIYNNDNSQQQRWFYTNDASWETSEDNPQDGGGSDDSEEEE